jgi:hypothetical protein
VLVHKRVDNDERGKMSFTGTLQERWQTRYCGKATVVRTSVSPGARHPGSKLSRQG